MSEDPLLFGDTARGADGAALQPRRARRVRHRRRPGSRRGGARRGGSLRRVRPPTPARARAARGHGRDPRPRPPQRPADSARASVSPVRCSAPHSGSRPPGRCSALGRVGSRDRVVDGARLDAAVDRSCAPLIGVAAAVAGAWWPARSVARLPVLTALSGRRPTPAPRDDGPGQGAGPRGRRGCRPLRGAAARSAQRPAFVFLAGSVAVVLGAGLTSPWLLEQLGRLATVPAGRSTAGGPRRGPVPDAQRPDRHRGDGRPGRERDRRCDRVQPRCPGRPRLRREPARGRARDPGRWRRWGW